MFHLEKKGNKGPRKKIKLPWRKNRETGLEADSLHENEEVTISPTENTGGSLSTQTVDLIAQVTVVLPEVPKLKKYIVQGRETLQQLTEQSGISKEEFLSMNEFLKTRINNEVIKGDVLVLPATALIGEETTELTSGTPSADYTENIALTEDRSTWSKLKPQQ